MSVITGKGARLSYSSSDVLSYKGKSDGVTYGDGKRVTYDDLVAFKEAMEGRGPQNIFELTPQEVRHWARWYAEEMQRALAWAMQAPLPPIAEEDDVIPFERGGEAA